MTRQPGVLVRSPSFRDQPERPLLVTRRARPSADAIGLLLPAVAGADREERPEAEIDVLVEAARRRERGGEALLRRVALRHAQARGGDVEVLAPEGERRL